LAHVPPGTRRLIAAVLPLYPMLCDVSENRVADMLESEPMHTTGYGYWPGVE